MNRNNPGNHLYRILEHYAECDRSEPWFSATVVTKRGSSYRRPGALMLISPYGQSYGLVSGGCLEADIVRRAREVYHRGEARYVVYDSTEDGNIAAELGLGCNGSVGVLIQQLGPSHEALLLKLLERFRHGRSVRLLQCYASSDIAELAQMILLDENGNIILGTAPDAIPPSLPAAAGPHALISDGGRNWSLNQLRPPPSLWVFGGGLDARPVVSLAALMGWRVTVVDHRTTYARTADFPGAEAVIRAAPQDYGGPITADAGVIMSHNLALDAGWLKRLRNEKLSYLGLLGPGTRKMEVFRLAGIAPDSPFAASVHGPMGLDLGGDLPESVALSVIAQCHARLFGGALDIETALSACG